MLGACTCGHDLADHLLSDGGAYCELTPLGQCACVRFRLADPGALAAAPADAQRLSRTAGSGATAREPRGRSTRTGGPQRQALPERGGGRGKASAEAIASVLTWLRRMEVTGGPIPRAHLAREYGQLWPAPRVDAVMARILTVGYAREDATGLHLTDAGRHRLAEQAERQRRGPS